MARAAASGKLATYRQKRDFGKTPEPDDDSTAPGRQLVVQQHFTTRLHYDLRLEIDGVLVSWAVTRGPSANPKDKRLAVRTEDHPLAYAAFEGTIPKGQYGGGTVVLWEHTTYTPLNGDPAEGLRKGEIKFESHGTRLRGKWVLVRMKTEETAENWLLIKERDDAVEADDSLATRFDTGVLSGLTRSEIEASITGATPAARKADALPLPGFVPPQLCDTAERVPVGDGWAFELKYDGYRLLLAVGGGAAKAFTRTGLDWSHRFPAIIKAAAHLPCRAALLDGEAVVLNASGIADFPALVGALESGTSTKVEFIAFDLLSIDGDDLRTLPYLARKARLKALLQVAPAGIRYGDFLQGHGADMLAQVADAGGEGVIAKSVTAPYVSGRTSAWLKIKTGLREDVEVIGFMPSDKGESFASLLAARRDGGTLAYAGRIGTGYNAATRTRLAPLLEGTVAKVPGGLGNADKLPRGAVFLRESFAAEVAFGGWTADGQMRQARFLSVQTDRMPEPPEEKPMPEPAQTIPAAGSPATWRITHGDRVVFPDSGVTKQAVANYYARVAPLLLPHLAQRPVSLLRAPDGIAKELFFQRHPLKGMAQGISVFGEPDEQYFVLDGEQGLATAVQFGGVELHGWNACLPHLNKPDRMVFDLDPDDGLEFSRVKDATFLLRDYLAAAQLQSWPLLSGGKGIHVVVPLAATQPADDVELFCKAFAQRLAADKPEQFTATLSKAKRKGRIFIDYLRNRTKATAILPWSLRARPGAPVAVPITWEACRKATAANMFTLATAPAEDGWAGFWAAQQTIPAGVLDLLR